MRSRALLIALLGVRALIEKGQLQAGEDFRLAAMVFQHGMEPRDYLFASDALRLQLGIPTIAEQTAQMQQFVGK